MQLVEIHEFSTGIKVQTLGGGSWVSCGFTGRYMNQTIANIPEEVERSIANREFAVSEGAYTDEPAIIARVVPQVNGSWWGVVAVVSRGQDEKSRSASFYRYFLCSESITHILHWMTAQKNATGSWPQFDPLEQDVEAMREVDSFVPVSQAAISQKIGHMHGRKTPYIWPAKRECSPIALHEMAKMKVQTVLPLQPIAWAFKVGALEKPSSFTIIYPVSTSAQTIIQRAISTFAPIVRTTNTFDESKLLGAVKSLMTHSNARSNAVETVLKASAESSITDDVWLELFKGRGSTAALRNGVFSASSEMIRLLALRAIVVPSTLPDFLEWMNFTNVQKNHSEAENTFISFLDELTSSAKSSGVAQELNLLLDNSISNVIIPGLLSREKTISHKAVYEFLFSGHCLREKWIDNLLLLLSNDASVLCRYADVKRTNKRLDDLKKKLRLDYAVVWSRVDDYFQKAPKQTNLYTDYYLPLIHLLELFDKKRELMDFELKSKTRKLTAYFIQISYGCVPSRIYEKAFSSNRSSSTTEYLGIEVVKQPSAQERILKSTTQFYEVYVKRSIVFALVGITFLFLGLVIGDRFNPMFPSSDASEANDGDSSGDQTSNDPSPMVPNDSLRDTEIDDAQFYETIAALNYIIQNIVAEPEMKSYHAKKSQTNTEAVITQAAQTEVVTEIKELLSLPNDNFNYAKAVQGRDIVMRKLLVNAIREYENEIQAKENKLDNIDVDGHISNSNEDKTLKEIDDYLREKFSLPMNH